MRRIVSVLILTLLVLFSASSIKLFAQGDSDQEPIIVVTKEIEPFVFVSGGTLDGFSIDLWEELAEEAGIVYEYKIVSTVQEQLDAVENHQADLAIAAISITEERETSVDFSHEYFESGLGILTNVNAVHSFRDVLLAAVSPSILGILGGLLITIVVAGHAIWLMERRRNPEFPRPYFKGIWEGIWWSAVTVTTVGYGDKVPFSKLGRIVAIFWMITGLLVIANFTANVTSELTFQRLRGVINGPEDLFGKRITTVAGTTADQWLTDRRIRHGTVETIEDAYALLDAGAVQAVVYDYPVLLYHFSQNPDKPYSVPGDPFSTEAYGIAFPDESPLIEDLNRALLRLSENGTYDQIYNKWYGVVYE